MKNHGLGIFFGKSFLVKECYFAHNRGLYGTIYVFSKNYLEQNVIVENTIFKDNFAGNGATFAFLSRSPIYVWFNKNYFYQNGGRCKKYLYKFIQYINKVGGCIFFKNLGILAITIISNNYFERNKAIFGGVLWMEQIFSIFAEKNIFFNCQAKAEPGVELGIGNIYAITGRTDHSLGVFIGLLNKYISGLSLSSGSNFKCLLNLNLQLSGNMLI